MDLRPVVWDATTMTPQESCGVIVVIRVTYRTLEQLCAAPFDTAEPPALHTRSPLA